MSQIGPFELTNWNDFLRSMQFLGGKSSAKDNIERPDIFPARRKS